MKKLLVLLAVIALFPIAPASADSINFAGTGLGISGFTATYVNGSYTRTYGYFAGQLLLTGLDGSPRQFAAFCLDFNDYLTNTQAMTARPISDFPNLGGGDAPPFARIGSGDQVGWLLNQALTATTAVQMGAIQLALWEVILDTPGATGYSLANGAFRVSGLSAAAIAQTGDYLSHLGTATNGVWLDVRDTGPAGAGQDFGFAVPEPGSILLLGLGLFGLGSAARRKARA